MDKNKMGFQNFQEEFRNNYGHSYKAFYGSNLRHC